jgi:hypothetical protein
MSERAGIASLRRGRNVDSMSRLSRPLSESRCKPLIIRRTLVQQVRQKTGLSAKFRSRLSWNLSVVGEVGLEPTKA